MASAPLAPQHPAGLASFRAAFDRARGIGRAVHSQLGSVHFFLPTHRPPAGTAWYFSLFLVAWLCLCFALPCVSGVSVSSAACHPRMAPALSETAVQQACGCDRRPHRYVHVLDRHTRDALTRFSSTCLHASRTVVLSVRSVYLSGLVLSCMGVGQIENENELDKLGCGRTAGPLPSGRAPVASNVVRTYGLPPVPRAEAQPFGRKSNLSKSFQFVQLPYDSGTGESCRTTTPHRGFAGSDPSDIPGDCAPSSSSVMLAHRS